MLVQNQAPGGEGSSIPLEPQPTPSTSQPNITEPQTAPLQTETHPIASHEPQTEAHIEQVLPSPSTYQRKHRKTHKHRRAKMVTKLPQTSVPQDLRADEKISSGDKPRQQETTLGGADPQTRFETASKKSRDPPLLEVNTSGSGEDRMEHPNDWTEFVPPTPMIHLSQEEAQTTQDKVITRLKLRVRWLEKKRKARTLQPMKRRLFKGGVETLTDKSLSKDASKQGINDDKTKELNLTDGADTEVIVEDKGSGEKGSCTADYVSTARPEVCIASVLVNALIKLRSEKAKVKGVAFRDVEEPPRLTRSTTTLQPLPTIDPKDKEFDEEQEKYTIEERERLLVEYFKRREKQLATERTKAIRNKPPTKTQVRNMMITYLKHMGKYTHQQMKHKNLEELQKLYQKEQKWINYFVPIDSKKEENKSVELESKGKKGKIIKRVADSNRNLLRNKR
nr:hypothetical protein [Tanacetum cinerariifolium]